MTSLSELYAEPELRENLERKTRHIEMPMDSLLASLDFVTEQSDILTCIDDLHDSDRDTWHHLITVMVNLPPQAILASYGENVLVWTAANATSDGVKKPLYDALSGTGYDTNLFEKSRIWCWQKVGILSSSGRDILAQYRVAEAVSEDSIEKIDLVGQLKEAALPGVELSDKRIADYGLEPLSTMGRWPFGHDESSLCSTVPGISYNIYLDAPSGFALTYKGKPNAIAAFACSSSREIMIYQLQGKRGRRTDAKGRPTDEYVSSRGLPPLDWQRLLVGLTAEFATNLDMESIGIQAGKNNDWTRKRNDDKEPHLSKKAATAAYDKVAKRLEFARDTERGNWHKPLSEIA